MLFVLVLVEKKIQKVQETLSYTRKQERLFLSVFADSEYIWYKESLSNKRERLNEANPKEVILYV